MGKGAGKGGDKVVGEKKEVLIDGRLYDVTEFKHPGGSVINFLTSGGDATDAFVEFHGRSLKAKKTLAALDSREATGEVLAKRGSNGRPELSKDYAALRASLEKEGFFDPAPLHVLYRVAEVVLLHLFGLWLFLGPSLGGLAAGAGWASPLPALDAVAGAAPGRALGVLVLGLVSGRCGWLMHEGGHYSLTGAIPIDRALQVVIFGVGCGMSGAWWRNQHNKHHATPQKLKHDVDLDTLPLIAFNERVAAKAKHPLLKLWIKNQALLFTPVSCLLVALGWQYFLHPRHILRTKRLTTEGLALAVRHVLFFGLVCHGLSWSQSIGVYLAYNTVAASYIFSQFAMSHSHLPVSEADSYLHWCEYASLHTTNIKSGYFRAVDWFMSFLNFQIEHHLFPGMPQFRHPRVSPRVKALFAKHGLPYDERSYFPCLRDTWLNLHQVGQSVDHKDKSS